MYIFPAYVFIYMALEIKRLTDTLLSSYHKLFLSKLQINPQNLVKIKHDLLNWA